MVGGRCFNKTIIKTKLKLCSYLGEIFIQFIELTNQQNNLSVMFKNTIKYFLLLLSVFFSIFLAKLLCGIRF